MQDSSSRRFPPTLPSPHLGNVGVRLHIKPPRLVLVLGSVINANSGARDDLPNLELSILDPELISTQLGPVERLIDSESHTEFSRTTRDVRVPFWMLPQSLHAADVIERFDSADEHRRRVVPRFGHGIQAKVEPVDHVHISATAAF